MAKADHQHPHHQADSGATAHASHGGASLNQTAFQATVHCLTGCAIGEVLGMVIGTAAGFSNLVTVALSVPLAFFFGYALTLIPLFRANIAFATALGLAFASDTVSITIMEIVDNAIMLVIPDAMDAGLTSPLFLGQPCFFPDRRRHRGLSGQPLAHRARDGARRRAPLSLGST